MEKSKLAEHSDAELKMKSKSLKAMIGLFVVLSLVIFVLVIRDYLSGGSLKWRWSS